MTNTKTMDFEKTPFKIGNVRSMKKNVSNEYLNKISSSRIIWHLVKRHKFGLVSTWAVVVTIAHIFPVVWDIVGSTVASVVR